MKVKRFYPNGEVGKEGQAFRVETVEDWLVYDQNGNCIYTGIYRNGNLIGKKGLSSDLQDFLA
ncbi:hypothetical protein [Pontibacter harenae]|uniref:hypothetical protein n=1 Tax=Pontibacter harenae TaxID=2894083 RepID=UPI001E60DFE3|nr:hypothetical protein [Pontibacter harenae]MCC9168832.1 hypothetical protein [Pontibacter harenae]